jgi:hypothetical protein
MEMNFAGGLREDWIIDRHFTVVATRGVKVQVLKSHLTLIGSLELRRGRRVLLVRLDEEKSLKTDFSEPF